VAEQEPDYESRQHEILEFVSKNANCTKADVIRYMKGRSALTTTHAILKDLIKEGAINVHKKNLQTHLLTINRESEFIWINNALADINDFIDRCEKITKKLQVFTNENLPQLRAKKAISKNAEFQYVLFLQKFIPPVDAMLYRLLHRSIYNIKSEKDAQLLNRRITDTMHKLMEMPLRADSRPDLEDRLNVQSHYSDRAINSDIDKINSDIRSLKRLSSKQDFNLLPEYDKLTNDFKQMAENFMKEYIRTLRAYHDSPYASQERKG
jgi:hypothetical protein